MQDGHNRPSFILSQSLKHLVQCDVVKGVYKTDMSGLEHMTSSPAFISFSAVEHLPGVEWGRIG